jgi:hypothetical protein
LTPQNRASTDSDPVDCRKCHHYYITWDKKFPYGCRAVGFKSGRMPAAEVLVASGKTCLSFRAKKRT